MNKKIYILFGFIFTFSLFSCDSSDSDTLSDKVVISGRFDGVIDSMIVLEKYGINQMDFVAAVPFENHKFKFYNKLEKNSAYQIRIGTLVIPFLYEGKTIKLSADHPDMSAVKVEGSQTTADLLEFISHVELMNSQIGIHKMMLDSLNNSVTEDSLYNVIRIHIEEKEEDLNRLIKDYAQSARQFPVAFIAINYLNPVTEMAFFDTFVQEIPKRFPHDPNADSFKVTVVNNMQHASYSGIRIGDIAPDFTLDDTKGIPVTLSSTRGKYVFLDFWASFCNPCRSESANKVMLSKEFSRQNFTIVSVSLDNSDRKWMAAIEKDGLNWVNLVDPASWDSELTDIYNIDKMPTNYLLDPQGRVIAKNLTIEDLHVKLNDIFTINITSPNE